MGLHNATLKFQKLLFDLRCGVVPRNAVVRNDRVHVLVEGLRMQGLGKKGKVKCLKGLEGRVGWRPAIRKQSLREGNIRTIPGLYSVGVDEKGDNILRREQENMRCGCVKVAHKGEGRTKGSKTKPPNFFLSWYGARGRSETSTP